METLKSKICTLVICSFLLLSAGDVTAKDLVFATDDTPGPPYIIGGGTEFNWDKPGIELEIYQAVAKKLDLNIKYVRIPWARCLSSLEHGKVDGIFPASFKTKRLKLGVYPMMNGKDDDKRKSRDNSYSLYVLKDTKVQWDGKNITGLTGPIGAPIGWAIVGTLKDKGLAVEELPDPFQSLQMLNRKRLQAITSIDAVMEAYQQNNPQVFENVIKLTPPLQAKPYYLMLSHQFVDENPDLAENIWNSIAEFKKTKTYQEIVAKYGN